MYSNCNNLSSIYAKKAFRNFNAQLVNTKLDIISNLIRAGKVYITIHKFDQNCKKIKNLMQLLIKI